MAGSLTKESALMYVVGRKRQRKKLIVQTASQKRAAHTPSIYRSERQDVDLQTIPIPIPPPHHSSSTVCRCSDCGLWPAGRRASSTPPTILRSAIARCGDLMADASALQRQVLLPSRIGCRIRKGSERASKRVSESHDALVSGNGGRWACMLGGGRGDWVVGLLRGVGRSGGLLLRRGCVVVFGWRDWLVFDVQSPCFFASIILEY
ncbi:uncharacterized protein J3D65DRAFT_106992 [Phyllosticta citribraziliensis]|uniref:Uncharacterized protein n=1 Tax=Phyllosticta citribraziliensis TaxID=989973 RepID=A0ABR1LF24_9PEZI